MPRILAALLTLVASATFVAKSSAQNPSVPVPPDDPLPSIEARLEKRLAEPPPAILAAPALTPEQSLILLEQSVAEVRKEVRDHLENPALALQTLADNAKRAWDEAISARSRAEVDLAKYRGETLPRKLTAGHEDLKARKAINEHFETAYKSMTADKKAGWAVDENQLIANYLEIEKRKVDYTIAAQDFLDFRDEEAPQEVRNLANRVENARTEESVRRKAYEIRKAELDRRAGLSDRLKAATMEDLVVALMGQAAAKEEEIVNASRELKALADRQAAPRPDPMLLRQIREKQAQVSAANEQLKASLLEAVKLAEEASRARKELFDAERMLIAERKKFEARPKPTNPR